MAEEIPNRIAALHEWYCRNVMTLRLTPEVERLWWEWLRAGYNGHDLRDVIRYIRRQISVGKRNEGALKLRNLFDRSEGGEFGKFDEDLGLSRARANLSIDKRLEPAPDQTPVGQGSRRAEISPPVPSSPADPTDHLRKLRAAIE